ncbi:MAG: translation initiation factor IF-3 [Fusobacteriaceae bacterium]
MLFFYGKYGGVIISDKVRINEKIRGKEFRIISDEGDQLGIMSITEALALAEEKELDLVEISPAASPPVCKIMNYGKFKYEQTRKLKEAKKNQKQIVLKEVKVSARIDQHDLDTKLGQIGKFLEKDNKVKVTLTLFGREKANAGLGLETLDMVAEKFAELADADKKYREKQKHLILSPKKTQ